MAPLVNAGRIPTDVVKEWVQANPAGYLPAIAGVCLEEDP